MSADLTFLSYNIHHGEGRDGAVDLQRLVDIITSVSPDLVALQEVDRNLQRTGYTDQVAEFTRLTGMNAAFSTSIDNGKNGFYGNMVLSRLPITKSKTYGLPGEPRSLLETRIDLSSLDRDAEHLMFYSTHLDLEQKHRLASVHTIRKVLTSFPGRRAVLAGDFNATPYSPTMRQLQLFLHRTNQGRHQVTFPGEDGKQDQEIDYILYRPDARWQVIETKVLYEPLASDHYPVMAILRVIA